MTTARIDVHHHYVTTELVDALERMGVNHVGGQPLSPSRPGDSLVAMDHHEIAAALLSVPVPLTVRDPRALARSLNEAGARAVADAPERFGLLAALPLPDVAGALAELAHALDTLNADGVMLLSNYAGIYLGDPYLEPIFAELDRRGAVALVHPTVYTADRPPVEPNAGSPVPTLEPSLFEFLFDTTRAVANLVIGGTLKHHPNVRLILAHAGGTIPYLRDRVLDRGPILTRVRAAEQGDAPPPTAQELQRMLARGLDETRRRLQRLFYDTTLSANDTVLDCLAGIVPSSHIVLGTDYPLAQETGITTTLAGLERHSGFDEADRGAIEGGNACRLFPRLAGAGEPSPAATGINKGGPRD